MMNQTQIREEIDQLEKASSENSIYFFTDIQQYCALYNQIDSKTEHDQRKFINYLHQAVCLFIEQKKWIEAENIFQLLIERLNEIPEASRTDEDKRKRAMYLNKLADSQAHQKKLEDAEKNFQSAIDELETISKESCTDEDERTLARCLYKLGVILSQRQKWETVENCYQRAVARLEAIPEKFHTDADKENRGTYAKSLREALEKQEKKFLKPLARNYSKTIEKKFIVLQEDSNTSPLSELNHVNTEHATISPEKTSQYFFSLQVFLKEEAKKRPEKSEQACKKSKVEQSSLN